jgi:hypothetical protein
MVMAYFATQRDDGSSVLDGLQEPAAQVETQPQSDMPPLAGSAEQTAPAAEGSDIPVAPAAQTETAAAPASDLPAVVTPEKGGQSDSSAASADAETAAKPGATAPQEQGKE